MTQVLDRSDGDPGRTLEACMRKFSEVRPLFMTDRDPGDEDDAQRPRAPLQLPAFATGGSMIVGIAGEPLKAGAPVSVGADGRIMMFRLTPGETIHVETPQQRELRMRQRLPRPSWLRRAWSWIAAWWCGR